MTHVTVPYPRDTRNSFVRCERGAGQDYDSLGLPAGLAQVADEGVRLNRGGQGFGCSILH